METILFIIIYFNSIKVQLRPFEEYAVLTSAIKFQFHKGTIKTDNG